MLLSSASSLSSSLVTPVSSACATSPVIAATSVAPDSSPPSDLEVSDCAVSASCSIPAHNGGNSDKVGSEAAVAGAVAAGCMSPELPACRPRRGLLLVDEPADVMENGHMFDEPWRKPAAAKECPPSKACDSSRDASPEAQWHAGLRSSAGRASRSNEPSRRGVSAERQGRGGASAWEGHEHPPARRAVSAEPRRCDASPLSCKAKGRRPASREGSIERRQLRREVRLCEDKGGSMPNKNNGHVEHCPSDQQASAEEAPQPSTTPDADGLDGEGATAAMDQAVEIARLKRQLEAAEGRASELQGRLNMWESLISSLSFVMAMGPDRGEQCKRTFMKELSDAIKSVDSVQEVSHVTCSIPAVQSEAPRLSLIHWNGELDQPMEWDVQWASACWSVGVSVLGRQYGLSFSLKLRVHHFGIKGRLSVSLPQGRAMDLSEARVSFVELPKVEFLVDSDVLLGVVPLPVQSQVDAKIRAALKQWLSKEMVEPNAMVFTIPSLRPKYELSDKDVQQAILDAETVRRSPSERSPWTRASP
mmetsp:Transcript_73066/g.202656  ORF Transcript_73066/g.202656 Transcript_73066/m.202656 type:complete len:533 (-) Transcript_73066:151-1749(-)